MSRRKKRPLRPTKAPVLGRPKVGPLLKAHCPPWIIGQLDALAAAQTAIARKADPGASAVPRADVARDALRAGLVAMREDGVRAEGFHPGRAMIEAKARGEPL